MKARHTLTFTAVAEPELSVVKLPPASPMPAWALAPMKGLVSITRTDDELSIVCATDFVLAGDTSILAHETGWSALKIDMGPLPFGLTGVLLTAIDPLADAGIGIFALSTFNTDWVLVKAADFPRAIIALKEAGHIVVNE